MSVAGRRWYEIWQQAVCAGCCCTRHVLQTLCKYYEKLLCCKSDLSFFLSLSQPHSFVCLYLLVWCSVSADKCTLKLFPLVLHSFAGKLQPDRYVQLASWHNCLPCTFCWRGYSVLPSWKQSGCEEVLDRVSREEKGSGKPIWIKRMWHKASGAGVCELPRCRGENSEEGTSCWWMTSLIELLMTGVLSRERVFHLMGFLSAPGMGDSYRY